MRHWGKYVPVLALAAFALFAVEASPAAAQQTGTITGTVTDAGSGTGLESAQVFLPNLDMGGLTNNAGRFSAKPIGFLCAVVPRCGFRVEAVCRLWTWAACL